MSAIKKSPVAEEIPFDPTGTDFPSTVHTVDDALRAIGDIDIETLTEFEAYESEATQSTTSNGWVTKSGYPYTTDIKSSGSYVIDYTKQAGQSDKEKRIGTRVQWRIGTSGTWQTLVDIRDALSVDNQFQLRSGFSIIDLPSDAAFQVRIQFGQTDDGGTGRLREANIKIGKVA